MVQPFTLVAVACVQDNTVTPTMQTDLLLKGRMQDVYCTMLGVEFKLMLKAQY